MENVLETLTSEWVDDHWELRGKNGKEFVLGDYLKLFPKTSYNEYAYFQDRIIANVETTRKYWLSPVFYKVYLGKGLFYLLLAEREQARLKVLSQITKETPKKEQIRIQKHSELVYSTYETKFVEAIEKYCNE